MSRHPLRLFSIIETKPLASNEAARWATLASAVGETKLALTVMLNAGKESRAERQRKEQSEGSDGSRGARAKKYWSSGMVRS